MLSEPEFKKRNLDMYLKALSKEYRKRAGRKGEAELILIGGASILLNYGFREMTTDIDAIIWADSCMKDAIHAVCDEFGLPKDWLNADFKRTTSYSEKLILHSKYYKTFSNVLRVRTVTAEYLVAMKLMAGRKYKHDMTDVVGVILEQAKQGEPLTMEKIVKAIEELYGSTDMLPDNSKNLLEKIFSENDLELLYNRCEAEEKENAEIFRDIKMNPRTMFKEGNISEIIEKVKQIQKKMHEDQTPDNR